jgi:hypothetical protein
MIQDFKGINAHERIEDGAFYDMLDLTTDERPVMKTRPRRTYIKCSQALVCNVTGYQLDYHLIVNVQPEQVPRRTLPAELRAGAAILNVVVLGAETAEYSGGALIKIEDNQAALQAIDDAILNALTITLIVRDDDAVMTCPGTPVSACSMDGELYVGTAEGYIAGAGRIHATGGALKQIVPMGRRICTDGGLVLDADLETAQSAGVMLQGTGVISLTNDEGITAENFTVGQQPQTAAAGDYWFNPSNNGLYRYSGTQWVSMAAGYIRLDMTAFSPTITVGTASATEKPVLKTGDVLNIDSADGVLSGAYIVYEADEDLSLVVLEGVATVQSGATTVTFERRAPVLDHIIEHDNRLWGCRYGENDKGEFVNEIYASALGDPLNFFLYEGTAADSWTAGVGGPGAWTGVGEIEGTLFFFKEDKIYVLTGSSPESYSLTQLGAAGVQRGSERSLCRIGGYLYYKSKKGVMRLAQGGYPVCVSDALGPDRWSGAFAATDGRLYYISMEGADGKRLFAYDTETGMWRRETPPEGLSCMLAYDGDVLALCTSADPTEEWLTARATYDEDAAAAAEPKRDDYPNFIAYVNARIAWIGRKAYSRIFASVSMITAAAMTGQENAKDAMDALRDMCEDGGYYVHWETEYFKRLNMCYLTDGRRPTDTLPTNVYAYSGLTAYAKHLQSRAEREGAFQWFGETGPLTLTGPDEKRLRRLQIRVKATPETRLKALIEYDNDGTWEELLRADGKNGTFRVAAAPAKRCDTYRLKLSGTGDAVIYSITTETEDDGDYV